MFARVLSSQHLWLCATHHTIIFWYFWLLLGLLLIRFCFFLRTASLERVGSHSTLPRARDFSHVRPCFILTALVALRYSSYHNILVLLTTFGYFGLLLIRFCFFLRTASLEQIGSHSTLAHARDFAHLRPCFILTALVALRYSSYHNILVLLTTLGYFGLLWATFDYASPPFAHTVNKTDGSTRDASACT